MIEYLVAYALVGALIRAASEAKSPAAAFRFGAVARWTLPLLPDAPEGWQ